MLTSGRVRRTVALAAVGGLASALTWLPAGPALALGPTQVYEAEGFSGAASGCTVTSGSGSSTHSSLLHSGKASGGVNLIATYTNGSNSADVTNVVGHYSGSTHLVKKNGAFRSATLTGSGQVSVSAALGSSSTCDVYAQMANLLEAVTQQPAGWYYVTRSTTKSSLTETILVKGLTSTRPVYFEAYQGGPNTVTQRAFVKPGQYVLALVAGIEAGDYPLIGQGKTTNKNTMSAVFRDAGSALAAASGSGATFVTFPASISCSHHSAKLTWRSGASKVVSGSFSVNGKKKASVSNPRPGSHVVLHNLSATADNTISAKLSLKGGGHASASRVYVPCKG